MKIYLASRYSRRDEMRGIASRLRAVGHEITSRWLETDWVNRSADGVSMAPPEYRAEYAVIDLADVAAAECVVNFTEPELPNPGRGGRHVEFGYGLALGKRVLVVGHRENLFHEHPSVEFFTCTEEAVATLTAGG